MFPREIAKDIFWEKVVLRNFTKFTKTPEMENYF